jgi:protein phosphatase
MERMKINVWCQTDKGLRRDSNQDSFLVNEEMGLYIVADGMGGHSGGEVASALAVKSAEEIIRQRDQLGLSPRDLVTKAFEEASRKIFEKASQENRLAGMGTTMVLCLHDGDSVFIGNVGDSRAYLFRLPHLWQMTEDHSLLNEQLRAGIINDEQAKSFASRNVITRSVGYEQEVQVDVIERPLQPGDCILICSDGLSSLVNDQTICEILKRTPSEKIVEACIERALANGGDDNVTVLFIQVSP